MNKEREDNNVKSTIRVSALVVALLLALALLAGCGQLDLAVGPLLYDVSVSKGEITPNADGADDATEIAYSLRRPADVSIFFENAAGRALLLPRGAATLGGRLQRVVGRRRG